MKLTIWLKDNCYGLHLVQAFTNVSSFDYSEGVYSIVVADGTRATFPVHNVLATLESDES